jgi:hypothetical protein
MKNFKFLFMGFNSVIGDLISRSDDGSAPFPKSVSTVVSERATVAPPHRDGLAQRHDSPDGLMRNSDRDSLPAGGGRHCGSLCLRVPGRRHGVWPAAAGAARAAAGPGGQAGPRGGYRRPYRHGHDDGRRPRRRPAPGSA